MQVVGFFSEEELSRVRSLVEATISKAVKNGDGKPIREIFQAKEVCGIPEKLAGGFNWRTLNPTPSGRMYMFNAMGGGAAITEFICQIVDDFEGGGKIAMTIVGGMPWMEGCFWL